MSKLKTCAGRASVLVTPPISESVRRCVFYGVAPQRVMRPPDRVDKQQTAYVDGQTCFLQFPVHATWFQGRLRRRVRLRWWLSSIPADPVGRVGVFNTLGGSSIERGAGKMWTARQRPTLRVTPLSTNFPTKSDAFQTTTPGTRYRLRNRPESSGRQRSSTRPQRG